MYLRGPMTTAGGITRGSDASDAILFSRSIWFFPERTTGFYEVPCVFEKVGGVQIGGGDA
ncbi:unnamed protein product [Rhodiola kirilowii]